MFAAGIAIALAGRSEIRVSPRPVLLTTSATALLLYASLLVVPVGVYFYVLHGDWFLLYTIDVQRIPSALALVGFILVVGVGSLMTTLARCCRPAPPDAIGGFVTRGKGVAVHRRDCVNFRHMAARFPGREVEVQWGTPSGDARPAVYPLDVLIEADDRQGLLRDITEVFAKDRLNVTAVNTQSHRSAAGDTARMVFTVEAEDAARVAQALRAVARVPGVRHARRR